MCEAYVTNMWTGTNSLRSLMGSKMTTELYPCFAKPLK